MPGVSGERDTRQLFGEIVGESLAVCWDVEQTVDVVEDVVLGDGVVVSSAEFG